MSWTIEVENKLPYNHHRLTVYCTCFAHVSWPSKYNCGCRDVLGKQVFMFLNNGCPSPKVLESHEACKFLSGLS